MRALLAGDAGGGWACILQPMPGLPPALLQEASGNDPGAAETAATGGDAGTGREGRNVKDRLPTEFEVQVLRWVEKYNRVAAGNKSVHFSAAARRLEKLGFVVRGRAWYLTDKGREHLRGL